MPSKLSTVYWDSCVFIDWMKRDKAERLTLIDPLVKAATNGSLLIVTSAWTLVEVVRTDDGTVRSDQEEKMIVDFFKNDYIEVRPLTRPIAEKSRELQRMSVARSLRMPKADSVHLATALFGGVPELHTFDETHLFPHDKLWSMPGHPALRIGKPCPVGAMCEEDGNSLYGSKT